MTKEEIETHSIKLREILESTINSTDRATVRLYIDALNTLLTVEKSLVEKPKMITGSSLKQREDARRRRRGIEYDKGYE